MERLTEKRESGVWPKKGWTNEALAECLDRLAAYEDTGLEPKEMLSGIDMAKIACALYELNAYKNLGSIDRLRKLAEADREGRLEIIEPDVAECVKIVKKAQAALRGEQKADV